MNSENKFSELINTNGETQPLREIDPECYKLSVQEFIEVVEDAKTHGITVHYLDGKLYYSYNM